MRAPPVDNPAKKSLEEWRKLLSPEAFEICRLGGTESPFSGDYCDCHTMGIYQCACCAAPLFTHREKYDSGSGWPSFSAPVRTEALSFLTDTRHGMQRTEIRCRACDAHLGHVFPDGPAPTGQRYCINSAALHLLPDQGE